LIQLAKIAAAKKRPRDVEKWLKKVRALLEPAEYRDLLRAEEFAEMPEVVKEVGSGGE
jgi:hypothetical protein